MKNNLSDFLIQFSEIQLNWRHLYEPFFLYILKKISAFNLAKMFFKDIYTNQQQKVKSYLLDCLSIVDYSFKFQTNQRYFIIFFFNKGVDYLFLKISPKKDNLSIIYIGLDSQKLPFQGWLISERKQKNTSSNLNHQALAKQVFYLNNQNSQLRVQSFLEEGSFAEQQILVEMKKLK